MTHSEPDERFVFEGNDSAGEQGKVQFVANLQNGATVGYKYFDFPAGQTVGQLVVEVRGYQGSELKGRWRYLWTRLVIRVSLKLPLKLAAGAQDWSKFAAELPAITGVHPLYLTWQGEGSLDFKSFELPDPGQTSYKERIMATVTIHTQTRQGVVHPELHGQFLEHLGTCIDGGIWVGENSPIPNYEGLRKDLVDALARIAPPLVRWPGGCFADMYHWRHGIGPARTATRDLQQQFRHSHPGNQCVGTHEFMALCRKIGAKPWLNVNMLTGSVAEMVEWAEYCNREDQTTLTRETLGQWLSCRVRCPFLGIGNEAWAGGGFYTAESYAAQYRNYSTAFPSFEKLFFGGDMTPKRPIP
jgi:hypothetical protein